MRRLAALALALALCAGCGRLDPAPTATATGTPAPTPTPEVTAAPAYTPRPSLPVEAPPPEPSMELKEGAWEETTRPMMTSDWKGEGRGILVDTRYLYRDGELSATLSYPQIWYEPEDSPANRFFRHEALGQWLSGDEWDIRGRAEMNCGTVEGEWAPGRVDDWLISVRYYVEFSFMGAAHPSWEEWAVTLDRETGELLSLADVVETGDDFETWLYGQDWTALVHWEGGDGPEYIRSELSWYGTDPETHLRDYYLTEDELVILGGYGRFQTPLSVPLANLELKRDV